MVTHKNVVNAFNSFTSRIPLSTSSKLLAVTPTTFDISILELFWPLTCGSTTIIATEQDTIDPHSLSRLIQHHNITHMQATPATWTMMLDSNWTGNKTLTVLCGGDKMSKSLAQKLLPLCKDLYNMYGPTETTIWSAVQHVTSDSHVTIGEPLLNTQIYVLDAYLNEVPLGCSGEIVIGGDGVTMGYLNDATKTNEKFLENSQFPSRVYKTGDIGKRLPNGQIM